MSNSFSPKKAPNVFNQETLDRALVILRQPFSIAVLASLGLHGLLWVALPNILAETAKEADTKQRVQVVELTPAEQSQLPSLSSNPIPPTLLPTTPAKPAQSNTKLPEPKLNNDPSLYNFPLLQPPPPDVFPSFGLPPTKFDFNPPPAKTPPKSATVTPPKPPVDSSKAPKAPETPPTDKTSPGATGTPTAPVLPEKLSSEQLARLQKDAQLQALYSFNGSPTGDGIRLGEILPKNLADFEDAVSKAMGGNYDRSSYEKPERQERPFPEEACSVRQPLLKKTKNLSIGAYFNPDGKLEGKPGLLLTSGFNRLDQLAIDYVRGITLKPSAKPRLVRFDLIFDPRTVCKDVSKPT